MTSFGAGGSLTGGSFCYPNAVANEQLEQLEILNECGIGGTRPQSLGTGGAEVKWLQTRIARVLVVPVLLTALVGSVAITATATPAAATVNVGVCPPNAIGGAPCYPGDVYIVSGTTYNFYSRAVYICSTQKPFDYQYQFPWPSFRTCMDYYLAVNGISISAHRSHVIDLYVHYYWDSVLWSQFNAFYEYWTWTLASMGEITYRALEPWLCVYLVAGTAGEAAVVAGVGCSYVEAYFYSKGW